MEDDCSAVTGWYCSVNLMFDPGATVNDWLLLGEGIMEKSPFPVIPLKVRFKVEGPVFVIVSVFWTVDPT